MGYSELDKTYLLLRSINWCTVVYLPRQH